MWFSVISGSQTWRNADMHRMYGQEPRYRYLI